MIKHLDFNVPVKGVTAFTTERGEVNARNKYSDFNVCNYTGDDALHVLDCRMMLCMELGTDMDSLVMPHQTHTARVAVIDDAYMRLDIDKQEAALEGVDALVTKLDGVCIGVNTADCVPIILADDEAGVVAAVHAGWRGTVAGIAGNAVKAMVKLGARAQNIKAVMGPSICQECFEVGDEVVAEFKKAGFDTREIVKRNDTTGKAHIDLRKANEMVLARAGVNNVNTQSECSKCNSKRYFSARTLGINSGRTFTAVVKPLPQSLS